MHDRVRIRALSERGLGPTAIARLVGCSRATVYRAIAPGSATSYFRAPRYADAIPRVEEVLAAYPAMPAPAVAIHADWPGSLRQLQDVIHSRRANALCRAAAQGVNVRPLPQLAPPDRR